MIREFNIYDLEGVNNLINRGDIIDKIDVVKNIKERAEKFLIYREQEIKGFAYMIKSMDEENQWNIQIYVDIEERRKGIGTKLYNELFNYLEEKNPRCLFTEFRVDTNDSTGFYEKLGYKRWYRCPNLIYRGKEKFDLDIDFVFYEDKYYDQYLKCTHECFYELRKNNDFKPYLVPKSEEERYRLMENKDSIYLKLNNNEEIISTVTVKDGYIDNVMVSQKYQGKGYGKKITQFAINKSLEQGAQPIYLCYVEGNEKANNLYKSLGFETLQVIDIYRKYMK